MRLNRCFEIFFSHMYINFNAFERVRIDCMRCTRLKTNFQLSTLFLGAILLLCQMKRRYVNPTECRINKLEIFKNV